MSAYPTPPGDSLEPLVRKIKDLQRQLNDLQRPSGTNIGSLVGQVQSLVAEVQETLVEIDNTVTASIAANSYTRPQVNNLIANPGAIAPTNVTASGQVVSAEPFKSPGSRAYTVVTGYVAAWINTDGTIGYSPSTKRVKKDLVPFVGAENLLALNVYRGRYVWDAEDAPLQSFLLAEEVADAGFSDMVPTDAEGIPETVNYSQLTIPIIEVLKQQDARLTDIEARLTAAGL